MKRRLWGLVAALWAGMAAFANGTVIDTTFYSQSLNADEQLRIYLPQAYDGLHRFPTIYFLHGMGATPNDYAFTATVLDAMIGAGVIDPVICVLPNGDCGPYLGSMWSNSELYGAWEDYVQHDVVEFMDETYHTVPQATKRVLMGHSMGGFGAMNIAIKFPDVFGTVYALSGLVSLEPFDFFLSRVLQEYDAPPYHYDPNAGFFTAAVYTAAGAFSPNLNNPPWNVDFVIDSMGVVIDSIYEHWLTHMPAYTARHEGDIQQLTIFFECGDADELGFYPQNLAFKDSLDAMNVTYDWQSFAGGHQDQVGQRFGHALIMLAPLLAVDEPPAPMITTCVLYPNYPNPFNSSTQIRFDLARDADVSVNVLNVLGQQVSVIEEGRFNRGEHTVNFDADGLASGVYIGQVNADGFIAQQKMVLLR